MRCGFTWSFAIDPNQVMSRQTQLDIANQLFADSTYPAAAEAYELFLRNYPKADQIQNVQLIAAIVYSRYLHRYDRAEGIADDGAAKLHAQRNWTWHNPSSSASNH